MKIKWQDKLFNSPWHLKTFCPCYVKMKFCPQSSFSSYFGKKICIYHIGGLVQERRNSIANALELRVSWSYPSICKMYDTINISNDRYTGHTDRGSLVIGWNTCYFSLFPHYKIYFKHRGIYFICASIKNIHIAVRPKQNKMEESYRQRMF